MLDKVSRERITDEIRKILASNNPYGILMKMQELGVLSNIMDDLNIEIKDLGLVQPMVILARLLKNNNFDGEHLSEILKRILKLSKKEIRKISFLHENRNLKFDNSISSIRRFQVLLTEEQKLAILQYHNEEDFNEKYHNRNDDINIRPILDGTKISEITGIKPSRKLGLLKDWLFRIQIEENINQENKMIEILHDIDWNDSDFESWPKLSWP